ncbi:MAG: VOC family protein [Planctomycetes bacterium]|nr:VOC family protein [Planctomycetota bacterium]
MALDCVHVVLSATNVGNARDFYVKKLGLKPLEDSPNFFAVRMGGLRISVFGGGKRCDVEKDEGNNLKLVLRTDNIEKSKKDLAGRGVKFDGEIQEAPGFMRYVPLLDPDNNVLFLAQYLGNPLAVAGRKLAKSAKQTATRKKRR